MCFLENALYVLNYGFLVGKCVGKLPLGRPRHKWENNIKVELKEGSRMVWTGLTCLRIGVIGALLCTGFCNFSFGKCREFLEWLRK